MCCEPNGKQTHLKFLTLFGIRVSMAEYWMTSLASFHKVM